MPTSLRTPTTPKSPDASTRMEDAAHFQQLLRELAISDTAPTAITTTSAASNPPAATTGVDSTGGTAENFDQIAYIIKQIFQAGKEGSFTDQLAVFIGKKEAEIEKMCTFHYQEFVQSVDQLLKVRQGASTWKDKILDLNDQIQSSGRKMVSKKREIIENRQTLLNIELAVESLQSCLFVLDMANKVNTSVETHKYYTALKMLEELQTTHLRPVMQYTFAQSMQEFIPIMQDKIRELVLLELQEWLATIKERTRTIGKRSIEQNQAKRARTRQHQNADTIAAGRRVSAAASSPTLGAGMMGGGEEEDHIDAGVDINFRPLYQCLHIHEVLNKRTELRTYFGDKRKIQASVLLEQKFTFDEGDLASFQQYLYDVVGFFIVEAIVMNSTQNFRSRGAVEGLWSNAMEKMNDVISESLNECGDPKLFLAIKRCVVHFIETMESYGFAITSLMDLMLSLLDRYAELMKNRCVDELVQIIEEDEYAPMIVNTQSEYDAISTASKLKQDAAGNISSASLTTTSAKSAKSSTTTPKHIPADWTNQLRFPKTLPFSRGFPRCCASIRAFVVGFYRFAEGFEQQYNEMDDLLKKSLEHVLSEDLLGCMMGKMMVNNISQVVQILVNLEWFEGACAEFEALLGEMRTSNKLGTVRLHATQSFRETRSIAEKRMFELLYMKMDDFLEMAEYDWAATTPATDYSPYLDDLVTFMNVIITSTLVNLPSHMRSGVYQGAFKHLATSIHNLVLAPTVKRVTLPAIDTLEKDVAFVEKFIAGVGEGALGEPFAQLRQTVQLLKSANIEDILNAGIRDRRYNRINLDKLAILLEKMKGDSSLFAKSTPAEKAQRKSIEVVLKGIRAGSSPTRAS
ncbi:exocyst complex subunit Sec15-like-domain-containing protein [Fimicolochytrium jonesii]|uniref:exocyst complex subunit Sec15-like-domain-containing protein n=1 Tax=Fimicolochytrium jonesii TaxID=1396493 RepID=UPI0022FE3078|nr:exocyst complex subunit Sec15-like-domain-containing protein [Fimicolochytrium jonesii]KAI8825282.1 exocyst complex subunit Sec15-like-domain-containing protein [Fimicolochytrium jonesii]